MNKHIFKQLQKEKEKKVKELYNEYHRLQQFYECINKVQERKNFLTLSQYNCFWAWYYNSDVTAREAYHYTFEEE